MIGNIETVEIKIDADAFQLTKLYAKDSYNLYLKCASILAPILSDTFKQKKASNEVVEKKVNLPIEQILNIITDKFSFNDVILFLKASNIKRSYKEINDSEWNVTSPLLIIELFAHVIKINVVSELLNSKKDFGQIVERLFGSKTSQNA